MSSRRTLGVGAIALATIGFGSGPVVAAMAPVDTGTIVVLRFIIAAPLLIAVLMLSGRRLSFRDLLRGLPGGVLLPLQVGLFFGAARLTSVADATFIMSLQPLLIFLVAPRLLGEPVTRWDYVLGLSGVCGVGLVVFGSARTGLFHPVGELLAIANLLAWTAYLLVSKWARSGAEPIGAMEYQTAVNLIGALVMLAVWPFVPPALASIALPGWVAILFLVLVPGVVAHVLNTWAQRHVSQTTGSVILQAQPAVAAIGAALFLGQPFGPVSAAGGALVLGAAVLSALSGVLPLRPSKTERIST